MHIAYKRRRRPLRELDDGLAAALPLGSLMKHYIRATVLGDEFNDPVARQDGSLEIEVPLIKPRRVLDIRGIDHQSVERNDGALR